MVFKFVGFFKSEEIKANHLDPVVDYLYRKWILQGGYEIAASFKFEYGDKSICSDDYCELDLHHLIRERPKK